MTMITDEYRAILQDFVDGKLTTPAFEKTYFTKFKNETREIGDATFEVLDQLFGDIDACTSNISLIAENPSYYIDEDQLKERVKKAIASLK